MKCEVEKLLQKQIYDTCTKNKAKYLIKVKIHRTRTENTAFYLLKRGRCVLLSVRAIISWVKLTVSNVSLVFSVSINLRRLLLRLRTSLNKHLPQFTCDFQLIFSRLSVNLLKTSV